MIFSGKKAKTSALVAVFAFLLLVSIPLLAVSMFPLTALAQGTLPGPPPDPTGSGFIDQDDQDFFGGSGGGGGGAAGGVVVTLINIFDIIITLLFILATVVFLWGIVTYLTAAGDESKIETGRKYIIWGIIALFVMVAAWGIVQILVNTFQIGQTGIPGGVL